MGLIKLLKRQVYAGSEYVVLASINGGGKPQKNGKQGVVASRLPLNNYA